MKKLFFLYVWLNLTRIAELRKDFHNEEKGEKNKSRCSVYCFYPLGNVLCFLRKTSFLFVINYLNE